MKKSFQQAVAEVYRWVDQQIETANPSCELSGRCCRFRQYGHKLYITRPEAELLFQVELPAAAEDSSQQTLSNESLQQGCPYQVNNLCTARENRPLGCRIYFCDPDHQEKAYEITETALKMLKNVHREYDKPWEYKDLTSYFLESDETDLH